MLREIDKSANLPGDLANKLKRGVILSVSVSTMDEKVSDMLEPGAAPPLKRLELIQHLKKEGFLVGVNAIPVLPYISDSEESLEMIVSIAKEHGADYVLVGGLTLVGNGIADSKTLFYKFLNKYDSSLLPKYEQLYGSGYYVPFHYQDHLKERARKICRKHGIRNSILA